MKNPHLIGLAGPAGSGKDTVGFMLQEHGYCRISFADPMRRMIDAMWPGILGVLEQDKELGDPRICGASYRRLMQTLGTEWGREMIGQNLWVELLEKPTDEMLAAKIPVVVTDVRFENEAAFIRDRGGLLVHIVRPEVETVKEHISENGISWSDRDSVIYNFDGLHRLRDRVGDLVRLIESSC